MRAAHRVALGASAFVCAIGVVLGASVARADGDPMADCISASDKGLDLRKQGKLIEAREVLATCAAAVCGPDISAVCRKRIADVNATLPSIVFLPKDASGADLVGVKVTIDGAGAGQTLDGRAIALDPGAHTFRFEAAGQPTVQRSFVLVEGARDRQERIDLVAGPGSPAAASPPAQPSTIAGGSLAPAGGAPPHAAGSPWKPLAFVAGGVGVLGGAAGSVLGLMASSTWSTSKSDCGSTESCRDHGAAVTAHDTAVTEATTSTVAFIVGGAALAASVVLFLTAPPSEPGASSAGGLRFEASVAPGRAGIELGGGF